MILSSVECTERQSRVAESRHEISFNRAEVRELSLDFYYL